MLVNLDEIDSGKQCNFWIQSIFIGYFLKAKVTKQIEKTHDLSMVIKKRGLHDKN